MACLRRRKSWRSPGSLVVAAKAQLSRLTGSPQKADLATAQQEVATAAADLEAARAAKDSHPHAVAAAEEAVIAAERKLQLLSGAPDPADSPRPSST